MLNLGIGEIAFIVVVAIVVVGPDNLPTVIRFIGKQYGKLMRTSNELKRAFVIEADLVHEKERQERRDKIVKAAKDDIHTEPKLANPDLETAASQLTQLESDKPVKEAIKS